MLQIAQLVAPGRVLDRLHRRRVPACVNDPDLATFFTRQFEPQWEGLEPLQVVITLLLVRQLFEEFGVALCVLVALVPARAQKIARFVRVWGGVADGIELVVAHHDVSAAVVDHRLDDLQHLQLSGPAVDEVTDEDRGAFRVSVHALVVLLVAELAQQDRQLFGVAVNVANDVVLSHRPPLQTPRSE